MQGVKYDQDKEDWSLLDLSLLEGVIRVLMHGAKKYDRDNWKRVEGGKKRYYSAMMRHLSEYQKGEVFDKDSGLPIIDHVICNALFLKFFQEEEDVKTNQPTSMARD